MEGLYLGLDLCSNWCQAAWFDPKNKIVQPVYFEKDAYQIPMIMCKIIGENRWSIGQDAMKHLKEGKAILVEKLMTLAHKTGTLTIDGAKYKAEDLIKIFMVRLLKRILAITGKDGIIELTITMEETEAGVIERLIQIGEALGIRRKSIRIINHTEAFLYYILNQPQDIWRNISCMFELTDKGLDYYEFQKIRGSRPIPIVVKHQKLEEKFGLDILEKTSGQKVVDTMLTDAAKKVFEKKVITSVFLNGRGFEDTRWAKNFIDYICHRGRVFTGENLYAQGAAGLAYDTATGGKYFPYLCLCEGRLMSAISIEVIRQGTACELVLAKAGTNWYEAKASVDLLLEDREDIVLTVDTIGRRRPRKFKIALDKLPKRPPKTTRVEFTLAFLDDSYMMIRVRDEGFGEFYPSSGEEIRQYIRL